MAKTNLTRKVINWATGSAVLPAVNPMAEYIASASYNESKQAVYDVVSELTSSTPYSASMPRIEFGSLVRDDHPAAKRINNGIWNSIFDSGSTIVHHDPVSGSFIAVSGSFYSIPTGSAHGKTHIELFELLENTIENKIDFRIATKKGIAAAMAEASASYTGSINVIKALP